jgi:hypothetical protein
MLSNAIIAAASLQRCCSLVCVRNESGGHPALLLLRHQHHPTRLASPRPIECNSRSAALRTVSTAKWHLIIFIQKLNNMYAVYLSRNPLMNEPFGKLKYRQHGADSILETPTVAKLLKKFPTFYGTRRFIIVLTITRHWSLSWARWIQRTSPTPQSVSLRSVFRRSLRPCIT